MGAPLRRRHRGLIIILAGLLGLSLLATVSAQAEPATATVEVTVWRRVSDPSLLYLSTRPEGGRWRTVNTALDMSGLSSSGRFHQSNAITVDVPLPDAPAATPPPTDRSQCEIDEAMAARVIASTVQVITPTGLGSAFYIGNGEFATAGHVVDDNPASITLRNSDISVSAQLVGFYPFENGDIALLRASAPRMAALEWAGTLAPGAAIAVVGYPEGIGISASITRGIVSRMFAQQGVSFIQTDSAVSPGNSGGPLVDACGRVAGVMSYSIIGERGSEGLHFAVAEPSLGRLLQALRAGQSPPPTEQPPDSTDPDEPTFWEINDFVDLVLAEWNATADALTALREQWNIITDYEDPPSNRLAANAREQRNVSQAAVAGLQSLRTDPATRNATASRFLEDAINYWSARATRFQEQEQYALGRKPWSTVLWARASHLAAYATYRQSVCDLWMLQGYSNAEEMCEAVAEAELTAGEARTEAEEREAWEERDSLAERIGEYWNSVANDLSTLRDQWIAVGNSVSLPSQQLANIAREMQHTASGVATSLAGLRSSPATVDTTTSRYLESAISYWSATVRLYEVMEQYALARASRTSAEQADSDRSAAHARYLNAKCDMWRLQEYLNADEACAEAGQ